MSVGATAQTVDLTQATIVYDEGDAPLVRHMAQVLADDIERVSGKRPRVASHPVGGPCVSIGTTKQTHRHGELQGTWERFAIDTKEGQLCITGSDARGLAYGVFHVSEAIGVSLSSLSNVGPSFGRFGPEFSWSILPDAGKILASFLMLIGRLEIFAVLLLFTPQFWKNR